MSVAFSPDGTLLASSGLDNTIRLWDVDSRQETAVLTGHGGGIGIAGAGRDGLIRAVSFSPDGSLLASGSVDHTVKLWDVSTRQEAATLVGHEKEVLSVAFSPDSSLLASGSTDYTVKLWNVLTREEVASLPHNRAVYSVDFSPDSSVLASASEDRTVTLWDVSSGAQIATLQGHTDWVSSVTFSPDGALLASASADGTIKLWDAGAFREVDTLAGHVDLVRSVDFSPDGATLVSSGLDATARLWDVASATELATFTGHGAYVRAAVFAPNGRMLASAGDDTMVKLWTFGFPTAAENVQISIGEGSTVPAHLVGSASNGGSLTYSVLSDPSVGSLGGTPPDLTYTARRQPTVGFVATDSFTFQVTDTEGVSDVGVVTVTIAPVNDPPIALPVTISAVENTPHSVSVSASDTDGDLLTYSIVDAPAGTLTSDPPNLIYTPPTDYVGSDSFTFRASDGELQSDTATVQISIGALNHAPTAIALSDMTLDEGTAAGSVVGTLSAEDPDEGDTHTYTILDDASGRFTVINGELRLVDAARIDYEQSAQHTVRVRAIDAAGATFEQSLVIEVVNVNEPPTAVTITGTLIVENSEAGSLVGLLATLDPDAEDTHTYELVGNGGPFEIQGTSLQVRDAEALDYEVSPTYELTVKATDAGGLTTQSAFTITVVDLVELAGSIRLDTSDVAENATAGDAVGSLSLEGGDRPMEPTYTLVDDVGGRFRLDGPALSVALDGVFDFEAAATHEITVHATTLDGLDLTDAIVVAVTDVNEPPTAVSLTVTELAENTDGGTPVGTLSVEDPDAGDTHTYEIVSGATDVFEIDGSALRARTEATFDHEAATQHDVTLRVTDSGGLTYEQALTIDVLDVAEPPEQVLLDDSAIREDVGEATRVGSLTTVDPDEGETHDYTLVDDGDGRFEILDASLWTVASASFDHETDDAHGIVVRVTDTDGLTLDQEFTVVVEDVNEAPSDITLSHASVRENSLAGSIVGALSATDPDDGDALTFLLVRASGSRFTIDGDTRVATTDNAVDFEAAAEHTVTVRVRDSEGLVVDQDFVIAVEDVEIGGLSGDGPLHGDVLVQPPASPDGAEVTTIAYRRVGAAQWHELATSHPIDAPYLLNTTQLQDGSYQLRFGMGGATIVSDPFVVSNTDTPTLTIRAVDGESGVVAVQFTTVSPVESDLATTEWEFSTDGSTWRPISLLQVGENFARPSGQHSITWDTQQGEHNLAELDALAVLFRMRVTDGERSSAFAVSSPFHVDNNMPPSISVQPVSGEFSGDVSAQYTLSDNEGDALSVVGDYSLDGGETWEPATLTGATENLTDYSQTVVWRAAIDAPHIDREDVQLRLMPRDADAGQSDTVTGIHIDTNEPPTVDVQDILGTVTANVEVQFTLADAEGDELFLRGEYSTDDGGSWVTATLNGADAGISLESYAGSLRWLSRVDLPSVQAGSSVRFRLSVADKDPGGSAVTDTFLLVNTMSPTVEFTDIVAEPLNDVVIEYRLASEDGGDLWLVVEFSTDGKATWQIAQVTGVTSGISADQYTGSVTWNSVDALPASIVPVFVRLTPGDGLGASLPTVSDELRIANFPLPTDEVASLRGHSDGVWTVAFSPDGSILASGSDDRTVKLWDVLSRQEVDSLQAHSSQVSSVAFSPDGATLASGSHDATVKLWDVATRQEIGTLQGHSAEVVSVAFSPDGKTLASGSRREVKLWDVVTRREIGVLQGHSSWVSSLVFSANGATLASGSNDMTIKLWNVLASSEAFTLRGHSGLVRSVAFSPNNSILASGGWDHAVRLWDLASRREIAELRGHSDFVEAVAFAPDGKTLASGSYDRMVKLWDVDGRQNIATLQGHTSIVRCIAFSPDGVTLASGSADHTIKLWVSPFYASNRPPDIAVVDRTVLADEGSLVLFTVAAIDPDGDRLLFTATGLPAGATLDSTTGDVSFIPGYTQAGQYSAEFTVNDGRLGTARVTVEIEVANVDLFTLGVGARSMEEGGTLTLTLTQVADLPDDVDVTAQGLPANAKFDADARTFTFTPDLAQAGDYDMTFRVTQGGNLAEEHTVTIIVDEARAFTLEPPESGEVSEGEALVITAERSPNVGADATLSASGLPDGATFDAQTGELRFTPDYTQAGEYVITLEASVGEEVVQTEQVAISVAEADAFAVAPGGDLAVAEGERLVVTLVLGDGATEGVTLSVGDPPLHAAFEEATGKLSFTPDYTHAGEYPITIQATQNGEAVQSTDIVVTVTDTALLTLTPSAPTVAEGGVVTVIASILDVAPGDITMDATDLPPNAVFDPSAGTLTFSPSFSQAGDKKLTVVVMQGGEVASEEGVTVVVENVPTFTIDPAGDQTLDEDSSLTIAMVRADGVPLDVRFSASSASRNASYEDASGTFVFSPDFGQEEGPHTVTFKAVQGEQVVDEQTISISVNNVDILSADPAGAIQVAEGASVAVAVAVAPIAQGKVTLSTAALPSNAAFDATEGQFTFRPDHSQSGTHNVTLRAQQGGRTVEQEVLRITVTDVNVPPTVAVTAPTTDVTGDVTVPYVIEDFDDDAVTLAFEYRERSSGAWNTASLDRSIDDTRSYSGSVVWRSREDIPSTGGVDVAFRVTPADAEQGAATTTDDFRVVNLLGDYDDDRFVGFEDLVQFEQAWKAQDISRDIGPAVGDVPDLEPVQVRDADLAIDFDDLTTFVRMWNWSAEQSPPAVAAMMEASVSGERLSYKRRMDGGDWSTQRVDITAPFGSATKAARLTFAVDPEAVTVRVRDVGDARAVLLTRRDVDAGIVEVHVAWLDAPGETDPLVSLDLTALRPGDADVRVAFDIRDADGRSRRGVDVFPLRFELPPTATRLLPNYPNPFNPETWIPFELAEAADVTVTIYDIEGSPVRSLRLGKQHAGRYRDRDRAAYWDGKNDQGEAVASGVYVCELRAGSHREIRRMVIRK